MTAVDSATAQLAAVGKRGGLLEDSAPAAEERTMANDRSKQAIEKSGGGQQADSLRLAI
ncbi:hypothetical protein PMIN04_001951 [Paraphaeosphaeria minitans]